MDAEGVVALITVVNGKEGEIKGTNDPETEIGPEGEEVTKQNPGAVIDDSEGLWVQKMIAGEFGVLVDWKNPKVLRRVVKPGEEEGEEGAAESKDDDGPETDVAEPGADADGGEGAGAEVG